MDCFNCSECGAYLSETFSMPNPSDPGVLVCPNCKDKHKIKETPKTYEEGGNYFARKVNMSLQINGTGIFSHSHIYFFLLFFISITTVLFFPAITECRFGTV